MAKSQRSNKTGKDVLEKRRLKKAKQSEAATERKRRDARAPVI